MVRWVYMGVLALQSTSWSTASAYRATQKRLRHGASTLVLVHGIGPRDTVVITVHHPLPVQVSIEQSTDEADSETDWYMTPKRT